jgi:hypothetical protein
MGILLTYAQFRALRRMNTSLCSAPADACSSPIASTAPASGSAVTSVSHAVCECSDNAIYTLVLNAFRFLQLLYRDAVIDLFGPEKPVAYVSPL